MTEAAEAFCAQRVLRRVWESAIGCSDVCQGADGESVIRLSVLDEACQKDFLSTVDPAQAPMLLERGTLEVLYPYAEGESLRQWLYECRPGLGQRRDACLSLLAYCAGQPTAPCVLSLGARVENLRFSQQDAWLLYLPDWGGWREGLGRGDGVAAVAGLCREILTEGMSRWDERCWPDELRVVCLRVQDGGYRDWGELSRDISELPDGLMSPREALNVLLAELEQRTRRLRKPALCAFVCVLLLAALLSLASAFRVWRNDRKNIWPGMTPIGNQQLKEESSR